MSPRVLLWLAPLVGLLSPLSVAAQWHLNGTPVCTAPGYQVAPILVPDGTGGVIVVWTDVRGGSSADIYAQRLGPSGVPQWAANGVPVTSARFDQLSPAAIADGAGGIIVAWEDSRSGTGVDIYAQRLNASGMTQWSGEVPVCTAANDQLTPALTTDSVGGTIVFWRDSRSGTGADVYCQRVDSSGVPMWFADGIRLSNPGTNTTRVVAVTDRLGGAIVAWDGIVLQEVTPFGTWVWSPGGVNLGGGSDVVMIPDQPGDAIIAYSSSSDIFAQRVDGGYPAWGYEGDTLCSAPGKQSLPAIAPDGRGGAIVAWQDLRGGITPDIYAQRVAASGKRLWLVDGIPVCSAVGTQDGLAIVPDGSAGAIIGWQDNRGGVSRDLYVQRVDSLGVVRWAANGVAVCAAPGDQLSTALAADGAGGAIVAWQDAQNGPDFDIYAGRIGGDGVVPALLSLVDANAGAGLVRLRWFAAQAGGISVTVERRDGSTDWRPLGTASADGTGMIVYEDRDVVAGSRYGYRLSWRDGAIGRYSEEAWVQVPSTPWFGLAGVRPNPTSVEPMVSFSLPSDGPVSLELMDTAGRSVLCRTIRGLGPGEHSLRLDGVRSLPQGLYWLRVRQEDMVAWSRVTVIR